jgi:DNA-binding GntR family transcriptional regulator
MIDRALAATDVAEVERLVGEMHRYLYDHANNITIGEIHTNYATNQKIVQWDLGRNRTTTIRAISFGDSLHSGCAW